MSDKDQVKVEENIKKEEKWEHSDDEKENNEEDVQTNQVDDKPLFQAPSYKKDKFGNVLIEKLDDYVEPPKTIKAARTNEFNNQGDMFEGIKVEVDNDEDNNLNTNSDLGSILVHKPKKAAKKEDLDDLLKEFGIEQKVEEEQKTPKPKKVKEVKEKVEKKEEPKDNNNNKTEEKKEAPKKKVVKKVTNDKSHLNEARREILERQEALKKKDKKK